MFFKIEKQKEEEILKVLDTKETAAKITHIHFSPQTSSELNLTKIVRKINAKCPNVQRLDLYANQMKELQVAKLISNRNNLVHLHTSIPIGNACLTYLALTCKLNSLTLSENFNVTDEGLESVLNSNLTYLDVQGCINLKGTFLKSVSHNISGLRLQKTNIDIKFLKKYLPNLRKLSDLRISGADDVLLATIAACCRELRTLYVLSSPHISDLWVGMIISQCKDLIRLNLAWCQSLNGSFLPNAKNSEISELWLTGCTKLNTTYLIKFLKNLQVGLRMLHLAKIPSVHDSVMDIIPVSELNMLNIQETSVSENGINSFLAKIKKAKRQISFTY